MTSLASALAPSHMLTGRGILRSEWSKLWSLRAPGWIALAMVLTPVALGMVRAAATAPASGASPVVGVAAVLESVAIGVLPLGFLAAALGLVSMGSEYVEDSLSVTFSVAPRRRLVLLAKCVPVVGVAAVAAALGLAGSAALAWFVLSARGYSDLPVTDLVAAVVAGSVGTGLFAVVGVTCTAIHRSTLGASLHLGALLALAPSAIAVIIGPNARTITDLLPATALQAIATHPPGAAFTIEGAPASDFSLWGGLLVLVSWAVSYLFAALALIRSRSVSQQHARSRAQKPPRIVSRAPRRVRLTALGVLRSETLKFLTLPATWWLLGLSSAATIGLALLQAARTRPSDLMEGPINAHDLASVSADQQTQIIVAGIGITQFLFAFLGALAFTSEFSSGNIQPTLIAVPRRTLVLIIKASVVAAAIALTTAATTTVAAILAHPLEQQMGLVVNLQAPAVAEAVLRGVIVSTSVGLLGCGIGVVLRNPIPAIGALVGLLVLTHSTLGPMQIATRGTPLVWLANLHEFFPYPVRAVVTLTGDVHWFHYLEGNILQLDPTQTLLITVAWALAAMTTGYLAFRRRGV